MSSLAPNNINELKVETLPNASTSPANHPMKGDNKIGVPKVKVGTSAAERAEGLVKWKQVLLGAIMMSTTFAASATIASSLLTIPRSASDLEITELQAQWITSAYSLANGCGLLFSGRLADLFGRKLLYLSGMAMFVIFNVASAIAHNYIAICAVRAFSGLSMAVALPASFGIVGVTFRPEPSRTIAFAALALGYPVGAGPGQILGGLISGRSDRSWQYTFFALVGLAALSFIGGAYVIPPDPAMVDLADKSVDWTGAFFITAGLSLFSFALTQSGIIAHGWKEPYVPALLATSFTLIVVFGVWEHHVAKNTRVPPLLPLAIFTRNGWKVTSVLALTFVAYIPIAGWMYLATIWFQTLKHESPLMDAAHVLPAPIVGVGACLLVPLLAPKIHAPYLLMLGGFSTAAAHWLFAIAPVNRTYWVNEFISNLMNPFGADFTVDIGSILISNLVDGDEQSLAGALFQTSIQIASTVGVCLCSLVQTEVTRKTGGGLETAMRDAFWMMARFSWLAMVIAGVALSRVRLAKDVGKATHAGQRNGA